MFVGLGCESRTVGSHRLAFDLRSEVDVVKHEGTEGDLDGDAVVYVSTDVPSVVV